MDAELMDTACRRSYGSQTGAIVGGRFLLRTALGDEVACDIPPEFVVAVEGTLYRDENAGTPVRLEATRIDLIARVGPGDWRNAAGCLPWEPGDEPAEVTIRRLRDSAAPGEGVTRRGAGRSDQ